MSRRCRTDEQFAASAKQDFSLRNAMVGQPVAICLTYEKGLVDTTVAFIGLIVHHVMYNCTSACPDFFLPFRDPGDPVQHALNECVMFVYVIAAPMKSFYDFDQPGFLKQADGRWKLRPVAPRPADPLRDLFMWEGAGVGP